MKRKIKSSISKKIKVTKKGRLLRLHIGNSHLKRKDDQGTHRQKKQEKELYKGYGRKVRKLL
ncbi:hypothetical protein COY33_00605 [candidate division WWE3 bacterium CG_4_10_14_0_2_um_filter_42_7]|uniref:50S ribosomal protein L35 n=2 Tax=Katanobacteria TaxID=422282 RepID=A0A2H0X9I3_UNCKA|nr:MAG: hypothetical protein COT51_02040 [candidate division WWE3 bacterium CG08_land_8_20_14_0_20_41_15]PIZ43912.1 MAG: hypothetical protein COY33_00605 [candidate division WWE3 bacterium CG_4_10_14_0_2_um_filter_42_7]